MARSRLIRFGALNITIDDHTPSRYVELFHDLFRHKDRVRYRGDRYGMIGTMKILDPKMPERGMSGYIHRFLEIPADEPWLNIDLGEKAEERDMKAVSIPANLKPSLRESRYVFFAKQHRMLFETRSANGMTMSAGSAAAIMENLLNRRWVREKYGEVTVIIEPSHDKLDQIFKISQLRRLTIEVHQPNPDDLAGLERKVRQKMATQKARILEQILTAERGKSLEPDVETKNLARVAASNGTVVGEGRDEEHRSTVVSTTDLPWTDHVMYDPNTELEQEVFLHKAVDGLRKLIKRLRGDG